MKKVVISLFVVILVFIIAFFVHKRTMTAVRQIAPESPQALAIESVGLAEFARGLVDVPITSTEDRMKFEKMEPIFTTMGDGKDPTKNAQAIEMLNHFIGEYPGVPEAYVMRATVGFSLPNPDYSRILNDLSKSEELNASTDSKDPTISTASILVMRAKVHLLTKNDQAAISDLVGAIKIDPSQTIFNNGGTKAEEETADKGAMQNSDFEYLVTRYLNDFRVYMARGVFYDSFTSYSESYFTPAFSSLSRAEILNPSAALVEYLLGSLYQSTTFKTVAGWKDISESGGFKDKQNKIAFQYFQRAAAIDPNFVEAWAQEAETLYSLKNYKEAIPYYDKVIELAPARWGAYNDRGMAKSGSNDYYGAIADFTEALDVKKKNHIPNAASDPTYESRADAYSKVGNYGPSIEDFGRAVGLKLSSTIFLMSLAQIRGMYPELQSISDSDLLEGLRAKYFPNMSSADFVDNYQKNTKPYNEFVLAGVFEKRGDAYLASKDFRNAAKEYDRARHMDSTFNVERWKSISKSAGKGIFLDTQTIDVTGGNVVSIWVKSATTGSAGYSEEKYQFDCSARKMRLLGYVNYDSTGHLRGSRDSENNWQLIVPESIGEDLANGACPR